MGEAAKVYVGNLPPETDPGRIRERFQQYGDVLDAKVMRNSCLVQFAAASMARAAIEAENGANFDGMSIQVRMANVKPLFNPSGGGEGQQHYQGNFGGAGGEGHRQQYGGLQPGNYPGSGGSQSRNGAQEGFGQSGPSNKPPPPTSNPNSNAPKPCDCEIVCVNRMSSLYCESVETRLRAMGMTVDVLFPTPGVQLRKILENIIGRGVTYAILVTPENQQNSTVTVNKLQGQQTEKLNIPVDAAIKLLASDFGGGQIVAPSAAGDEASSGDSSQIQMRGGSQGQSASSGSASQQRMFPGGGHPPDVMTVVDFLVDNRPLSVMEYDKLIRYLSKKREEMLRREYGDDIPAHLVTPSVGPQSNPELRAKEEEFKSKILDVLSRPLHEPKPSIAPSLQSAIDSLFKGTPAPAERSHQSLPANSQSSHPPSVSDQGQYSEEIEKPQVSQEEQTLFSVY